MELTIDRLTKQYQNKIAVDRVTLTLTNGVYGLLGANGAGKTTLMRMLCGILKPTSGEVKFDGIDVASENYRDVLGYLPQDFGYYPKFTAFEFLCYIATLKGLPKERAKEKSKEFLELVSLSDVAQKKIKTFSGGMKQRLGIAQAMLNNPKILILDEPTAGLDPKERVRFRNLISQLGEERIVLLSTHIVSDIENIARTILVLKNGQLIHNGSLEQIIQVIENKVWQCTVDRKMANELSKEYPIINLRQEVDGIFLRLISSENPCKDAVRVTATLEDLYLYYFSEVNKDE
ncbi:ABC transporter ATP-binding protein [Alkaliphilus peptidifermentans]|uniref:ABC-2 type transport system ATP-binding protein n=1 Tax=Alkaliphilus peptidifermentans DSM 18978 TaxID=1120976 RepID=A0A1G5IRH9_9FIRM|nr:ABC transporter ATP-binding protein [Alkaliphilus peptidifermentans]SCY78504.1 ABC-2 type transport system ATP-binding protein [Alkaliphilus peptidifermentans DSM 18978]